MFLNMCKWCQNLPCGKRMVDMFTSLGNSLGVEELGGGNPFLSDGVDLFL